MNAADSSPGSPSTGSAPAPVEPSGGVAPPDTAVPLDAADTRGKHFRSQLGSPLTLSLGSVLVIGAFVAGAMGAGPAVGAAAAAGAILLILLIVFVLASNAAKEDFYSAYAGARGLHRIPGQSSLPPSTPLLRKGDKRYADQVMNGTLPGGSPGALALYTYEEETRDSDGNRNTSYYRFTVVLHDVPAVASKVSDVLCQRRSGFRFMDGAEDAFRRMKRLELESDALDRRYEIFYGADDDENWMKQLFSPSFIVWLTERPPKDFAFELSAGSLCVNTKGHREEAADLDELCKAASQVARRLAGEATG
ncbi:MAG: hypothetical protein ABIZ50_08105 [Solirubrobacterales bacterium]